MRRVVGVCAAALVALGASSAGAAVVFTDNFDAEIVPAGGWIMNDASFANFDVTQGTVDLLATGNPFGLPGVGNFVDLDGSTRAGGTLQTISQFSYQAGETVTLDVRVAGNHRSGTDNLFAGFAFSNPMNVTNIVTTGFTGTETVGPQLLGTIALGSGAAYQDYTISFEALASGTLAALVGTDSHDNKGPLLDGLTLMVLAVPEPSGWSLMILGFGGMGAVLRRRRAAASVSA
jgi:hypothetical protein